MPETHAAREASVAVRGVEIFTRRVGEGPPAVVLHGGPGAHHDYLLPGFDALAHRRELVYYDQRGGGRSPGPARRAGRLDRARGRPRGAPRSVVIRAARAHRLFVGRPAGAALRPGAPRAGWSVSLWCRPRRRGGRRGTSSKGCSPGATWIPPSRRRGACCGRAAARARSGRVPAADLRAVGGAVLLRSGTRPGADAVPGHRADPAGSLAEPRRLRPPPAPAFTAGHAD